MKRYTFHMKEGSEQSVEAEIVDVDAVKRMAVKTAGQLLTDSKAALFDYGMLSLRVTEHGGRDILTIKILALEADKP